MDQYPQTNVLSRTLSIIRVSAKYFLFYKLNRYSNESLGRRLRLACEELGPVFVKIGQTLSTRYELLSKEDCEELSGLLDNVAPLPEEVVRYIFWFDFGKTPEQLFKYFDGRPIASASIAQVYKAQLHTGEWVAVKVRRPNIQTTIHSDLAILKVLGNIAQIFSSDLRRINLRIVLKQIEGWLFQETDFRQEAKNIHTIYSAFREAVDRGENKHIDKIVIPNVYNNYCSKNIVTMDFIEGVSMSKLESIKDNPEYDPLASVSSFLNSFMYTWLNESYLYFHGDPHPANILILKNGKLAILDFGLVGFMDKKDCEETRNLLIAVYSKNLEGAIEAALQMCNADQKFADRIRSDVKAYLLKTEYSGFAFWFVGFIRIFIKHKLPLPYQLVMMGRVQALLENLLHKVAPNATTLDVFGKELKRGLQGKIIDNILSTDLFPVAYALSEKLKKSPEMVAGLIDKYFDDPLQAVRDLREAMTVR